MHHDSAYNHTRARYGHANVFIKLTSITNLRFGVVLHAAVWHFNANSRQMDHQIYISFPIIWQRCATYEGNFTSDKIRNITCIQSDKVRCWFLLQWPRPRLIRDINVLCSTFFVEIYIDRSTSMCSSLQLFNITLNQYNTCAKSHNIFHRFPVTNFMF